MSDLIDRQEAIDALEKWLDEWTHPNAQGAIMDCIQTLNGMPSAQPQRPKGKWIEQDDGWDGVYYECSVCKEPFTLIDGTPKDNLYNFCPNCGAEMRGDADG